MVAVGGVPGLYLQVTRKGGKTWVLRATVGAMRRDIGLGGFPAVTLSQAREKAREEARKRMEEEAKKPAADRKVPEFGSDKDFQLVQALNQLKGRPVLVSKTLTERKEEKKEN